MNDQRAASERLDSDDFRARRDFLSDDAFALVTGTYQGATDLVDQEQWQELIDLPTDVALRTSDQLGTQLGQLNRLWGLWIEATPVEPDATPFMFSAMLDAGDDFNAATFTAMHGYYRQGFANLRSALDGLAIAASFAVRNNKVGLDKWLAGESEPPKFGNARDMLAPHLGTDATGVLTALYKELSGYIHAQASATNATLWGGSNGPIFERQSFVKLYRYFRDVMAMSFALVSIGWDEFSITCEQWQLFDTPNGAWANVSIPELKLQLATRST